MILITKSGWESMGTWLLATSCVVAPIRFATNRSMSGWTVRSFLATMYQLGFDLQAVPPTFALNRSAAGPKWVAQTSFFSCSDKSRDAGFCWRRFHFALLWFHPISFSIELDNSTFRGLTLGSLARGLLQDFAAFVVFCPKISRRVGPANLTI